MQHRAGLDFVAAVAVAVVLAAVAAVVAQRCCVADVS